MKLYTKGGDKGQTSLIGGSRVSKCDPRVEAYGTVDELTAFVALLGDNLLQKDSISKTESVCNALDRINSVLMSVEALLAADSNSKGKIAPISEQTVSWLEEQIDSLQSQTPQINLFTIPGGCTTVSLCHVCRTICRRAERRAIAAANECDTDSSSLIFLNRLSDYFYALGRYLTHIFDINEKVWIP